MNTQEVIDSIKNLPYVDLSEQYLRGEKMVNRHSVIDLVKKLDGQQKVAVPQFVAEWIELHKNDWSSWDDNARAEFAFRSMKDLLRFDEGLSPYDFNIENNIYDWVVKNGFNFLMAILIGYTIEQEKLDTVEIPDPHSDEWSILYLAKAPNGKLVIHTWSNYTSTAYANNWKFEKNAQLTESEIRKDFDWAWQAGFAQEVGNE